MNIYKRGNKIVMIQFYLKILTNSSDVGSKDECPTLQTLDRNLAENSSFKDC